VVDHSSFSSVGSLFHARGAVTEKALSLIRRHVHGTTRSPDDEARNANRAGTLATNASRSEMYTAVCPRSDLWIIRHNLYWILSANWCLCVVSRWRRRRFELLCCCCCQTQQPISQLLHAERQSRMLSWWGFISLFFSGIFLLRVNHMYANDNQLTDVGRFDSYPIGTRFWVSTVSDTLQLSWCLNIACEYKMRNDSRLW